MSRSSRPYCDFRRAIRVRRAIASFALLFASACSEGHLEDEDARSSLLGVDDEICELMDSGRPTRPVEGLDAATPESDDSPRPAAPTVSVEEGATDNKLCKVSLRESTDGGAPELVLERFAVSLSDDVALKTSICSAIVKVTPPAGHTFAVETILGAGQIWLPEGARASFGVSYGPLASPNQSKTKNVTMQGPRFGIVRPEMSFSDEERQFWPCGSRADMELSLDIRLLNQAEHPRGRISWTGLQFAKFVTRPCAH